ALTTRAERVDDGYRLTGVKTFVSDAPEADLFLVFATVARDQGVLGITGFLVERGAPGLHVGRPIGKMGLRTSPMAEVTLDGCLVPAERRLGREGRGAAIFNDSMEWERGCLLSSALGSMRRQLDRVARYARERR